MVTWMDSLVDMTDALAKLPSYPLLPIPDSRPKLCGLFVRILQCVPGYAVHASRLIPTPFSIILREGLLNMVPFR